MTELSNANNSIPYIIIVSFLIFMFIIEQRSRTEKQKKQVQIYSLFILLLFLGLRGHLYSDYTEYYPFYQDISDILDFKFRDNKYETFEPGFLIYTSILKTIMPNYFVWVFFNCFIDLLFLLFFFRKYSNSVILSFIIFIAFQGLIFEFNLYRNIKSLILFLVSIKYLRERKSIKYFALNTLGLTFHSSSILFIPCYFFLHKNFSRKIMWTMFVIVNIMFITQQYPTEFVFERVASILNVDMISSKILKRLDSVEEGVFSVGYFERSLTFIFFISNYSKLCKDNGANQIFCNCFFLYYILFYMFADVKIFVERIPTLFIFSYWVLYPNLIKIFKPTAKMLTIVYVLILCLLKTFMANKVFTAQYDNLLWGIRSYEERSREFYSNRDDVI